MNDDFLVFEYDDYQPSPEEEKDYWSGKGHLVFHVISYDPTSRFCPYEIEIEDYSGCVRGLDETLRIEYAVNERILNIPKLRIGWTYEVHDIEVVWTRGDGWTTDDDVDYYVGSVTMTWELIPWLKAWWWYLIGHKIRNWRNR